MSFGLSNEEVKDYLEMEKIIESYSWKEIPGSKKTTSRIWRLDMTLSIRHPDEPNKIVDYLSLIGRLSKLNDTHKFSMILLHNQRYVERGDLGFIGHKNPDNQIIPSGHKHKVSQEHGDKFAWVPDDVDWSSPKTAIKDILNEWNIVASSGYPSLPGDFYQVSL